MPRPATHLKSAVLLSLLLAAPALTPAALAQSTLTPALPAGPLQPLLPAPPAQPAAQPATQPATLPPAPGTAPVVPAGQPIPQPSTPGVPTSAPVTAPGAAGTGGLLPLVSVGVKWVLPTETYTIVVSPQNAGKPLGLSVYSPSLNLLDYADGRRGAGYFGDELYKKNEPFETVFSLSGPGGSVTERRYAASREHSWESLYAGGLPAGTYTLRVRSSGDGKNSFALRVDAPFELATADFTVNARDSTQQALLAARLTVPAAWVGRTLSLSNYDIDGPREAETWAVQPDGTRVNLPTSDNGKTATSTFTVTPALVGEWQVYLRVLPTTRQYSNSVQYSFRIDRDPVLARVGGFADPSGLRLSSVLSVDVVDPQGRTIPGATYTVGSDNVVRPRLPQGYVPVSASVLEGSGAVASPTELSYTPGPVTRLRFVARPPQGTLAVDAVALYGGQRFPLTSIPFEVGGKVYQTPITLPLSPGDYPVKPSPVPGSSVAAPAPGRVQDGSNERVTLEYRVLTEVNLSTAPDLLNACDVTQLIATAKTDFPYRLNSTLTLNLPLGWTSDYPLVLRGDLSSTTPLRLRLPVQVCRSDTAEAVLDPVGVRATGDARVRSPSGVNLTRTVEGGARVRLVKSAEPVSAGTGAQGYAVRLVMTVDGTVDNLRILDPLPQGGNVAASRSNLTVQGPSLANLTARQDGDTIVLPRLISGTYTVSYTLVSDLPADRVVTTPELRW